MKHVLATALASVSALFLVSGCGGGGGGGGGATVDVLIGDAPRDDLLSFSAVVQSVRLQRDDASFTSDLVSSLEVEFLGLNGALVFLAHGRIPAGTYVAMEVGFAPGQYQAQRGDDSSSVAINAAANTYLAMLAPPLTVASGGYARFTADLDLLASLAGDVTNGFLTFDPSGSGSSDDSGEAPIDELKGPVQSSDLATRLVVVDGFVGPQSSVHLGRIEVHVPDTALLLSDDNMTLTVTQFFAAAVAGTFLEVHGNLAAGGRVEATRIEIEDGLGGGGGGNSGVRIEGIVTDLGVSEFTMRIRRIKDGASIAEPILAQLQDPTSLDVTHGGSTLFVFDSGGLTDASALAKGQEVKVRFSAFATTPFPASEVEIDDTPGFHGELLGPGTLPGSLAMRLAPSDGTSSLGTHEPGSEVELRLDSASIRLALGDRPVLRIDDLRPGMRLEPHGSLDLGTQTIRVERMDVRPGFLEGASPADVSAAARDLVVDGGRFVDSFGRDVTPGPVNVQLVEDCRFLGDARSAEEFFLLLGSGARSGTTVDVFGLPGGSNRILAYALRLRLP